HSTYLISISISSNVTSSDAIGTQPNGPSFKPLGRHESTIRYLCLFTSWLCYLLRCISNPELDPDLYLHTEHKRCGRALLEHLRAACRDEVIATSLEAVSNVPGNTSYISQHPYLQDRRYPPHLVVSAASLFNFIHTFAMSLLEHPVEAPALVPELSLPIVRFFAWKAWDDYARSFRTPGALHGFFCQLQWMLRLVTYQQFLQEVQQSPGVQVMDTLKYLHDRYLLQDTLTPFGILQSQIRYSCIIASSIAYAPTTTWQPNTTSVSIHGETVSLETFITMIKGTISEARRILDEELLFGRKEEICGKTGYLKRAETIVDNTYSTGPGYSYISANRCFTALRKKLATLISYDQDLRSRFTLGIALENQETAYNYGEIKRYLQAADAFSRLLAILVYWASGQPCRLPELVSLCVENLTERPRNVYAMQGHMTIIQTYTKSLMVTMRPSLNVRLPAHEIQELFEAYWSLVHPLTVKFWAKLQVESFSTARALLFTQQGRPMTETEVSQTIRHVSRRYAKFNWGVRMWRQWMISMSYMELSSDVLRLPLATTVITAQASHQQHTADHKYDQRIDMSVNNISTQHFQQYRMASLAWLELIDLKHPHLSSSTELSILVERPEKRHQTAVVNIQDMARELFREVMRSERASIRSIVQDEVTRTLVTQNVDDVITSHTVPLSIKVDVTTFAHLQRFHPGCTFRSVYQAECTQYVLERRGQPLLVVLPMGHGKSLIYQLPVFVERGHGLVTILIVPLLSLAQAACHSAKQLNIKAHFINPRDPKPEDSLVSLDAELLIFTYDLLIHSSAVCDWIRDHVHDRTIPRIIVDEAHTIITEIDFRTPFAHLPTALKGLAVPLILMTGTLPLAVEHQLLRGFSNCGAIPSVRLPTERPNLSYRVSHLTGQRKNIEEITRLYEEEIRPRLERDLTERAILFVQTVDQAREWAARLRGGLYINPLDLEEKQGHLQTWLNPQDVDVDRHLIVATSSLCLGIDYDNCRNIWFYGDPYGGVINFSQMASRAGRDGEPAIVRLFPAPPPHSKQEDPEWTAFKTTTECRRTPISQYLDGRQTTCAALSKGNLCDNCLAKLGVTMPSPCDLPPSDLLPTLTRQVDVVLLQRMVDVVQAVYDIVDLARVSCIYCRFICDPTMSSPHGTDNCPTRLYEKRAAMRATLTEYRERYHVDNFVACIGCHLPQHRDLPGAVNAHLPFHGHEGKDCELLWVVVDIFLGILSATRLTRTILSKVPRQSHSHLLQWLLSPVKMPPCDTLSPGRQLLHFHFILVAAAFASPSPPFCTKRICSEGWFHDWLLEPNSDHTSRPLLSSMRLSKPSHSTTRPPTTERTDKTMQADDDLEGLQFLANYRNVRPGFGF
ncbi:hypothetical protein CPB86DRAFT_846921, partial [Serendipita vermifera]